MLLASAFLALAIFLRAQTIQPIWERTEATDGVITEKNPFVKVDAFHNAIVFGNTYSAGPLSGFITTKYDSSGGQIWQRYYDTFASDLIADAVIDKTGDMYVGGNSINPFTNQSGFVIFKYAKDGDSLWQYSYNTTPAVITYLSTLLLDSAQNLLIFGHFFENNNSGLIVIKLDQDGNTIWEATYDEGNYGYTGLAAIRVGNDIAYWGRVGSPEGPRFFSWRMTNGGVHLTTAVSEPYNDIFDVGYHIDSLGNLYIGDGFGEYKVTKFNLDGSTAWAYSKPIVTPNPNGISARLLCIETDIAGTVFISGTYYTNSSVGVVSLTSKLNVSGELLWAHSFTSNGVRLASPYKSKWITDDLLLVTGTASIDIDSNFYEYFIAIYDSNGFVQGGVSDIDGRRNWPTSIAPDGGFFYVGGKSDPENTFSEPRKQFLCKYALEGIVGTTSPVAGTGKVEQLTLSPNPFRDKFRVSVSHEVNAAQGLVEVRNSQGKIVALKAVSLVPGGNNFEINSLQHLPTGVYSVSLTTSSKVYFAQAVKI